MRIALIAPDPKPHKKMDGHSYTNLASPLSHLY